MFVFLAQIGQTKETTKNNIYIYILIIYTKEIDFERRRCHPENVQTFLTGGESLRKRDFFFCGFVFVFFMSKITAKFVRSFDFALISNAETTQVECRYCSGQSKSWPTMAKNLRLCGAKNCLKTEITSSGTFQ